MPDMVADAVRSVNCSRRASRVAVLNGVWLHGHFKGTAWAAHGTAARDNTVEDVESILCRGRERCSICVEGGEQGCA
eukprot:350228-Chlamydomonas_euryale.AAC.2